MTCASSRTSELIRALQEVLQGPGWSDVAVEDFLVLMLLESGIEARQLDDAGDALFTRFFGRVGIDAEAPADRVQAQLDAYFERHPPPQGLTAAWAEQCKRRMQQWGADAGSSAATKLGRDSSWRPVTSSGDSSLFRWRLRGAKPPEDDS